MKMYDNKGKRPRLVLMCSTLTTLSKFSYKVLQLSKYYTDK